VSESSVGSILHQQLPCGTHFCQRLSKLRGPVQIKGLGTFSDIIGSRTRNFSNCSTTHQPSMLQSILLISTEIETLILSRITRMCGAVTNNYVDSDWIPDLFTMEVYSCKHYNYYLLTRQLTTKYRLSDLTPITTETLLNIGFLLL
jgi:hypothetical protein